MSELPIGLKSSIESGNCVLFIGAGIGAHFFDSKGNPAPDGKTLAKELANHFSITQENEKYELTTISQIVEIRKGRLDLETFIKKRLSGLTPDENIKWLFSRKWRAIYTTNYDNGIQETYKLIPDPLQQPITITLTPEVIELKPDFDIPIYHLHGSLFGPSKPQIVITKKDYPKFREKRKMLFELLKREFATSTVLYIGYSNSDPNWDNIINEIQEEFYPSEMPRAYRISPHENLLDQEILDKANGIETINIDLKTFVEIARNTISKETPTSEYIDKIRSSVPPELIQSFEENPVPVIRLLDSWQYVDQAPFSELPNLKYFLNGDKANWALIGANEHFERDIEEEIYENLLDYATSSARKPQITTILGPAGYGISTLLMSLATKLIKEKAGAVFYLKPGKSVSLGDIEYAMKVFKYRPFFFVDNAADSNNDLDTTINRLRETKFSAMFVLGERLNEWRQIRPKFGGKEFALEPLSDPEINRLLDFLGRNSALNTLEDLPSRDHQFAVIKEKHQKELLVVMREATEGKSFDAILEDEYQGIGDTLARQLYLIICCIYQNGAYARDGLLAQLLDKELTEFFEITKDATEGIIVYDCVDETKGIFVARARHRTIAKVVWERCGEGSQKVEILLNVIKSLNLNFKYDKIAFDLFIRSDRLIESIDSLEGRTEFFETACRKEPESPYVRQHYARMLARADKPELALKQIDSALEKAHSPRIIYHTKGMILAKLSTKGGSPEIGKRRLVQSEDCFFKAMSIFDKDEYSFTGLAQLYFNWAVNCASTDDEAAEYISKAEDIIGQGLKKAKVRDGLWIESAKIQQHLGNSPKHLEALEKAVADCSGSVIARFLLGRAYRKSNQSEKALEILDPVVKNNHDEFRVFVEYALCLLDSKKPLKNAIAILKLSTLYGLKDAKFISTLGGMLFMNGNFSEAESIFSESNKVSFSALERQKIYYRPRDPDDSSNYVRIKGEVITIKPGYVLIDAKEGYPRFLCPSSKSGGLLMTPGLKINFALAFCSKGHLAVNPKSEQS